MATMKLPSPILSITPSDLFDLIRYHCGQEALDIVLAQKIHDIQTLLRVKDVFSIVHLPTNDFQTLKEKVAVQLNDGTWSILIGVQARVDQFMTALKDQASHDEYNQSPTLTLPIQNKTLSTELMNKFPLLNSLIEFYSTIDNLPDQDDRSSLISIINNICANLTRTPNNYRYSDYVHHFALSLFIYAGQNAYRLLSMNIPGFLPSITTIRKMLNNSSFRIHEAEFRFDEMVDYFTLLGSKFAFAAEDTTGIISKVVYDSQSNYFIGFNTPLAGGIPLSNQYQTDSFLELKQWFEEKQKSSFINVHMLQPVLSSSSNQLPTPFLLSAYGINGKYTASDILNRWLWIYEETKRKDIRILAFASDCDPRYLSSMRVASGFFVSSMDQRFQNHSDSFKIDIPTWKWFFMRSPQLCFFMQVSVEPLY